MKKITLSLFTVIIMLSMIFSSSVFAANEKVGTSAWDTFKGFFTASTDTVGVQYKTHIQNKGTETNWASNGSLSGTVGEGLRLEALWVELTGDNLPEDAAIDTSVHVQNKGDLGPFGMNTLAGTSGEGLRLERITLNLENMPADYEIRYNVQVENLGWLKNETDSSTWFVGGEKAGTEGSGLRLEGIRIEITKIDADLTDYNEAFALAEEAAEEDYTNESWSELQDILDYYYDDITAESTQADVDEATDEIMAAYEDLVELSDFEAYDAIIALTDGAVQADYTVASWTNLQTALNNDKVTDQSQQGFVDETTDAIEVAYNALVLIPKVSNVTAINATQLQVTFNSAIDKTTVFTAANDGTLVANTVSITPIGVTAPVLKGVLSTDGKTLTLTSGAALTAGRNVVVVNNLKDTTGATVAKYDEILTIAADKTAPTIVSTTKLTASTFKVTFSEPINSLGTATYKLANGTSPTVTPVLVAGNNEVVFTISAGAVAGDVVTATFVGASDIAGNLLTPNPATTTFTMGSKDGVIPTIASINQTGAKTFDVKFSEELNATPGITITGNTLTTVKSTTDATVYNVTGTTVLDGLTTVNFAAFTDLSGEIAAAQSKVATFTKDAVAPKVVSSAIVADATTGKQFIELTFDKDVTLASAQIVSATGSYVKDYVTSATTAVTATNLDYKVITDKKVVRGQLSTLLTGQDFANASYTLALNLSNVASPAGVVVANPTNVTFTRGVDGSGSNATVLAQPTNILQGADNNKVNVVFPSAVDGASAINIANYSVGGATIESVSLLPLSGGAQTAVLNLVSGSNAFTGARDISVANVKALGSTATMVAYSKAVTLNENIKPTVSSAKVTNVTKEVAAVTGVTGVTAAPATVSAVTPSALATGSVAVTGTYTGTTDKTITLTKTATGYSFDGGTTATADNMIEGLTFTVTGTPTTSDTFSVNATKAITEVTAVTAVAYVAPSTTVEVTYSEAVKTAASTYVVNVGGTVLAATNATIPTVATADTKVTVTINKELTAANFASGVTLTATDFGVTDAAGNKANIGTTGIAVIL